MRIQFSSLEVAAAHNDYEEAGGDPEDFVQWGTVLECEAVPGSSLAQAVDAVAVVLQSLWDGGYRAVAACDYEDQLPVFGG
ncbi:hypothetical protein [Streptomyces sp. NPDC026092]|uniref:hypothetical protein n=1 Tax=Streptomyces sp. NPDC026092 TaxID=3154797 RepID=UPI0033FAA342